jgi:adenylate cyclase
MKSATFVLTALLLVVAAVYLFASAPPPLPEGPTETAGAIQIERVLETVAAENDVVRALYTQEIVTRGTQSGLLYDEDWRDDGVDAGPLPALFLREAARSLQASPVPLGLFLGSDYPIAASNRFEGTQLATFQRLKETREPEYFYAEDTQRYTAMFPDFSGVQGCVTCHNEHPETTKNDWALNDVMGATTWMYPKATVSPDEYLRIVAAVRQAFRDAYRAYLDKVATFEKQPEIGEQWPADGFYVPSEEVFMAEFERRASARTVDRILLHAREGSGEG